MLTANEVVDGGSGWSIGFWVRGAFLEVWIRGGDGLQVAEDDGSLEPHEWRSRLLYTPASVRPTAPVSPGLPGEVDVRMTCTRETSIGDRTFAVSVLKNLHPPLASPLALRSKNLRVTTWDQPASAE